MKANSAGTGVQMYKNLVLKAADGEEMKVTEEDKLFAQKDIFDEYIDKMPIKFVIFFEYLKTKWQQQIN